MYKTPTGRSRKSEDRYPQTWVFDYCLFHWGNVFGQPRSSSMIRSLPLYCFPLINPSPNRITLVDIKRNIHCEHFEQRHHALLYRSLLLSH